MAGSTDTLLYAVLVFVGSHLALSAPPVRPGLVALIGENGFRLAYSLVAGVTLAWLILTYRDAPYVEVWMTPPWAQWFANLLMPVVCVLFVCGLTSANPTMIGGEAGFQDTRRPGGILTVTRHPMLWSFGLWGVAHIPANGDMASVLLFGGMAFLSFAGMLALDVKKRDAMGAAWGPIAMTTSVVPFVAAIQGRTRVDWSGIGWKRIGGGLLLWAILHGAHPFLIGVPPLVLN